MRNFLIIFHFLVLILSLLSTRKKAKLSIKIHFMVESMNYFIFFSSRRFEISLFIPEAAALHCTGAIVSRAFNLISCHIIHIHHPHTSDFHKISSQRGILISRSGLDILHMQMWVIVLVKIVWTIKDTLAPARCRHHNTPLLTYILQSIIQTQCADTHIYSSCSI